MKKGKGSIIISMFARGWQKGKRPLLVILFILAVSPSIHAGENPPQSERGSRGVAYLYELGVVYYNEGEYEEASHAFEKVLLINPDHEGARRYLKKIEAEEKKRFEKEKAELEAGEERLRREEAELKAKEKDFRVKEEELNLEEVALEGEKAKLEARKEEERRVMERLREEEARRLGKLQEFKEASLGELDGKLLAHREGYEKLLKETARSMELDYARELDATKKELSNVLEEKIVEQKKVEEEARAKLKQELAKQKFEAEEKVKRLKEELEGRVIQHKHEEQEARAKLEQQLSDQKLEVEEKVRGLKEELEGKLVQQKQEGQGAIASLKEELTEQKVETEENIKHLEEELDSKLIQQKQEGQEAIASLKGKLEEQKLEAERKVQDLKEVTLRRIDDELSAYRSRYEEELQQTRKNLEEGYQELVSTTSRELADHMETGLATQREAEVQASADLKKEVEEDYRQQIDQAKQDLASKLATELDAHREEGAEARARVRDDLLEDYQRQLDSLSMKLSAQIYAELSQLKLADEGALLKMKKELEYFIETHPQPLALKEKVIQELDEKLAAYRSRYEGELAQSRQRLEEGYLARIAKLQEELLGHMEAGLARQREAEVQASADLKKEVEEDYHQKIDQAKEDLTERLAAALDVHKEEQAEARARVKEDLQEGYQRQLDGLRLELSSQIDAEFSQLKLADEGELLKMKEELERFIETHPQLQAIREEVIGELDERVAALQKEADGARAKMREEVEEGYRRHLAKLEEELRSRIHADIRRERDELIEERKRLREELERRHLEKARELAGEVGAPILEEIMEELERTLGLDEAKELAIANFEEVRIAEEEVRLASAKLREALRNLFPSASLQASDTRGELLEDVEFIEKKYGLLLEQPLFRSGALVYAYKQAKLQYKVAEKRLEKVKIDLAHKVTQGYYELVNAKLNLALQEDLKKKTKESFEIARRRFDQGLSTEEEWLNVSSKENQIAFQFASAERDVSLARVKLLHLLNIKDKEKQRELPEVDTYLEFRPLKVDLDEVLDLAFKHRAEFQIAKLLVEFNELEKRIARGKDRFKIDLVGYYGQAASYYATEEEDFDDDWNVGVKVSKSLGTSTAGYGYTKEETSPKLGQTTRTGTEQHSLRFGVLDNMKRASDIREAEVNWRKAVNDLNELEKQTALEAKEAYFDYQEAVLRVRNSLEKIKFFEQKLASVKLQVQLNEALTSQLLEVGLSLADEEALYIQALTDHYVNISKLERAIGVPGYFKEVSEKLLKITPETSD